MRRAGRSACSATRTCRSATTCRAISSAWRPPTISGRSTIPLDEANRYLVNPGSVGQPRDGDPRAGFGIVDTDGARGDDLPRGVSDCEGAGAHLEEGLPDVLAQRLALGR